MVKRSGVKVGGQCEGSRSGEWSRSWGGGQCLADRGQMVRWGEVGDKQSVPLKNS